MNRRILVVDDEESIQRSLESVLRDEGFDVSLAGSAEDAIKKIEADAPDIVLLDIWLPGKDGLQLLEEVRPRYPGLPVVVMSGHGTIETAVRATKLGAFDFVEKPLNLDKVLLCLDKALKSRSPSE